LLLPWYAAVIVWLVRDSELVESVALPFVRETVPKVVAPSLNMTLPAGVPPPGATAVTVAVKVTDWPKFEGLSDDVTTEDVDALFTTCVREGDVLVVKLASSLYTTVIE
jgi:hypothetical protein